MPTNLSNATAGDEGMGLVDALQECFACGVLVLDAAGNIVALTPQTEQILRLHLTGAPARSVTALPSAVQSIIREARTSGGTVADRQMILYSHGPSPAALSVTALPLDQEWQRGGGVVVVVKDVSETGKLEHRVRRLDRLASVGTLSASMVHEIKNALVPVRTFVDLLLEKNPEAELAETVRRELNRVDTIVTSVLKFAAPAKPEFSSVRLHETLDLSLRLVQHRVEGKPIEFERRFNAESDVLRGDDHQLQQAFVNLFLNAVEAMGARGALTVTTGLSADDTAGELHEVGETPRLLCVQISDTGGGIPPEDMAHIFEPFFTTKQSGTGLGLSVTRRIIEEHNGVIRASSEPGQGTTFTILLPACSPAASG